MGKLIPMKLHRNDIWLLHFQNTYYDSSKLKEFADDSFRFDKNGRKIKMR